MGSRRRTIKVQIVALLLVPLVSLVAIWGFAATVTVNQGKDLLRINTVASYAIVPTTALSTALQQERLASSAYLGSNVMARAELDKRRAATDAALEEFEKDAFYEGIRSQIPPAMMQRLTELHERMERIADIRGRVDTHGFTRLQTVEAYSGIVEAAFRVYDKMRLSGDIDLIDQTRAITLMSRSRELLSQQSALISGALASGRITGEELTTFRRLTENRRLVYTLAFNQLDAELRTPYVTLQTSPAYRRFEDVEDSLGRTVPPNRPLPREAATWADATSAVSGTLDRLGVEESQKITERATPIAAGVFTQISIAGGLGLIAVALSIFVSVRFARRISAEIGGLQTAALTLADERLPHVVERLRRGETVNVAEEAPDITAGTTTEIAGVSSAFASVQHTAIEAAVGQAEIRKGVNQVFLNLARRSQSLLHRQLSMLEGMERRVTDPETLDGLFALDHLTTRMRRHSEGLIILSGAVPGRGWRNPVNVFDVIRAAVEEVEDYLRVSIDIQSSPAILGNVVTDVIHLLAELVENATMFSPPNTQVHINGEQVARGYAIEVEDRGLGMTPAELAHVNERLASPPEFDLADSDRLGLFVVGRLAARHGISVSMRPSPYGGTTAIVLIPDQLVVKTPESASPLFTPESDSDFSVERIAATESADLPKRVRQAGLPRETPPPEPFGAPGEVTPGSLLTSFQAGWHRAEQEDRP
ncbi:hypothetical protein Misp01_39460 [Microtetraspora sp. NBRC 13810]|uniref:sensor histidine kinase n=1 Tax=Microtetraspora sp. NBRC 13810 TaxID=3030990 RepID=UPI0025544FF3|nr:nitrate- and nitrite sensing domain-containing protein [Microtetraspora sp. NBRC 13810]GLW08816.1 hypothetical protein Misp01_39460 [Microtetraspora sp. NBRC 13810]